MTFEKFVLGSGADDEHVDQCQNVFRVWDLGFILPAAPAMSMLMKVRMFATPLSTSTVIITRATSLFACVGFRV
jgi:hypothetical protein